MQTKQWSKTSSLNSTLRLYLYCVGIKLCLDFNQFLSELRVRRTLGPVVE